MKTNIIVRLLQWEADHVRRREGALTALTTANYKFFHVGTAQISGCPVYSYKATPRVKQPGLFKGRIYLDPSTAALVRTEGIFVTTPSFLIRKITFMQDYAQFGDFTFPVHAHVVAFTRVIGPAVIDIYRDYQSFSPDPRLREAKNRRGDDATTGNDGHFEPQVVLQAPNKDSGR